jgi:hypothetical protein
MKISKTLILPVVLYGCKTWSLPLREEHKLRVFEKRVLIFAPNDELHSLYSSSDIIRVIKSRRMRWVGHVACMEEGRVAYMVLVGKPEGKRPQGIPRCRWVDNIKMGLREIGISGVNWIQLAQDKVQWQVSVNTVMNL